MRTMRDHGGETPEERMARVERLLRAASSWEPDAPAPARLAERAMARRDAKGRERERAFASRRPTTWWGFGTITVSAAALLLVWGRVGPETEIVTAETMSSPSVQKSTIPSPSPLAIRTISGHNDGNATQVSPLRKGTRLETAANAARRENPTTTRSRSSEARVASTVRHSFRRMPVRRHEVRPMASHPATAQATTATPKKATGSVWTDETVTRDDYRMLVPVVLTQQSDGDDSGVTATPAVIEVAYDPHAAPIADYR
jgi:hypothetical protein